jgi:hypothetical protein
MPSRTIKSSGTLEKVLSSFDERQLRLIMANTGSIQLTDGCSIGCPFCGFESKKGVRDYIPFKLLERLVKSHSKELAKARPFLYYASDPFDYDFDRHSYVDVHKMFEDACDYSPCVSTAVPKGKESLVIEVLLESKKWNNSTIDTVSISNMNRKRLEKAFSEYIPSLNPAAQKKIRYFGNGRSDSCRKEICKQMGISKKEYHKLAHETSWLPHSYHWYSAYILKLPDKRLIVSPEYAADFRDVIKAVTKDDARDIFVAKLGEKHKDDLSQTGIGCYHGVLMDPLGVYNLRTVKPSLRYPTGQIKASIIPGRFKVAKLKRARTHSDELEKVKYKLVSC